MRVGHRRRDGRNPVVHRRGVGSSRPRERACGSGRWRRPGQRRRTGPPRESSLSTWGGVRRWSRQRDPHRAAVLRSERTGHALIGARPWIPAEQIADPARAQTRGLPVELVFRTQGQLGLDQSPVRRYTAIMRYTVLVRAALAICSVAAAPLRRHTDTQAPPPTKPDQPPPLDPGRIPLTVPRSNTSSTPPPAKPAHWATPNH
jgi:hypothetical protein